MKKIKFWFFFFVVLRLLGGGGGGGAFSGEYMSGIALNLAYWFILTASKIGENLFMVCLFS